jgi:hypothetical protein
MFQGLVGAMDDPANELVYLYEVRDAAAKHFQKATLAQKALGLSKSDWSRLGGLANDLPLKEGRHRGRMAGSLRNATETELGEARGIARYVVESFASRHA